TGAYEDGVDGTMILAPGTIIYPFKSYTRTPINLRIEAGRIVDISGELDAGLMRDYMDQFNDPDGYAISHIGWGLNEKCLWSGPMMDTRGIGQRDVRSTATSCSPPAPTRSWAAATPRRATWTSRCTATRCTWMTARSSTAERSS